MISGERRRVPVALSLVALVLAAVAGADMRPEPPWAALEAELRQRGVKTDERSVVEAAGSTRDSGLRWFAIEIIGLRGYKSGTDVLRQVVQHDSDRLLQETAALALARLGEAAGREALKAFMETAKTAERRGSMAARLAELGDPAGYKHVVALSTDVNAHLRQISVGFLVPFVRFQGSAGPPAVDVLDRLGALARDVDPEVRKELINGLTAIPESERRRAGLRELLQRLADRDPDEATRELARTTLAVWPQAEESKHP